MRLIFMGTPTFAVPPLQALLDNGYTIVAVYTQPPRPKNRGHHLAQSPVHVLAESFNIPVYTPTTLRNSEEQILFKHHHADLAIVVAYGLILPAPILQAPRLGCINIHGSLLPRWRGAAPIHRAMLAGDALTGITLMHMDEGLDTGDMLSTATLPLDIHDHFEKVHDAMSDLGANLLIQTLPAFIKGQITPQKQPSHGVTYAHKITKDEGVIDWALPATDILRRIKTLNPWPGTATLYKGQPLKIREASLLEMQEKHDYMTGTLLDNACVLCKDGILSLDVLQKESGKPLLKDDFLRGFPLEVGTLLGC